jgi:hypothetical protein
LTDNFHFWVPLISASIKAGAFEQATRRLASTGSFMQNAMLKLIPDSIRITRRKHLMYSKEKILQRMEQSGSEHKDFLYYLLKQQDDGAISTDEVIVNGALFMYAYPLLRSTSKMKLTQKTVSLGPKLQPDSLRGCSITYYVTVACLRSLPRRSVVALHRTKTSTLKT